jgi:uncharacterized protein YgiM (DUF1202 family)
MRRLLMAVVSLGTWAGGLAAQQLPPLPPINTPQIAPPGIAPPGVNPPAPPAQKAPFPAEMTIIAQGGVEVRSGPTTEYYPTGKLNFGEKVLVLRESKDQPGWYAIKPPAGSFSWVNGKYVKVIDQRTGVVESDSGQVPVLPGSSVVNKEPNVESVKIATGFLVTLLDRPMQVSGQTWYPIAPPPHEARFIPKEAVMPPQTATVAPENWARAPGSFNPAASYPQNNWSASGQLASATGNQRVGTPASYSQQPQQPQSPWTQYNGVAPQPPQWSNWGKLRRTAFDKDGQPMYVLEDRAGRIIMYVTSAPGTSLRNYIDQTVCLYGSISYRSDGYQRTHYMTASHVATP